MFKRKTLIRDYITLSESEQRDAFCVLPDHQLWRAVIATIYDHIDDARIIARDMRTAKDAGMLAHACGAQDALETLAATLEDKRKEANK